MNLFCALQGTFFSLNKFGHTYMYLACRLVSQIWTEWIPEVQFEGFTVVVFIDVVCCFKCGG